MVSKKATSANEHISTLPGVFSHFKIDVFCFYGGGISCHSLKSPTIDSQSLFQISVDNHKII